MSQELQIIVNQEIQLTRGIITGGLLLTSLICSTTSLVLSFEDQEYVKKGVLLNKIGIGLGIMGLLHLYIK